MSEMGTSFDVNDTPHNDASRGVMRTFHDSICKILIGILQEKLCILIVFEPKSKHFLTDGKDRIFPCGSIY